MMKRFLVCISIILLAAGSLSGCGKAEKNVNIGVSFGVGAALRWEQEKVFMEEKAAELGVGIEIRLNKGEGSKTQLQDCIEMIDSGIDVLILKPKNGENPDEIVDYANSKKVAVISYSTMLTNQSCDLFVGYDTKRMGQKMGQYLTEAVYEGDYIILRGDADDSNALLLYEGAMQYIAPVKDNINILTDQAVVNWSPEEAAEIVTEAILANDNKVDAILAPNDKIAGACAEVIAKLGLTNHVVITGMDAELEAAKRIVAGTQDTTIYMDLSELAHRAVEEAINIARKEKMNVNTELKNQNGDIINGYLITGQLITKDNLDKVLIDSGYFTKEQIYE